jgi:hypothetical protein
MKKKHQISICFWMHSFQNPRESVRHMRQEFQIKSEISDSTTQTLMLKIVFPKFDFAPRGSVMKILFWRSF